MDQHGRVTFSLILKSSCPLYDQISADHMVKGCDGLFSGATEDQRELHLKDKPVWFCEKARLSEKCKQNPDSYKLWHTVHVALIPQMIKTKWIFASSEPVTCCDGFHDQMHLPVTLVLLSTLFLKLSLSDSKRPVRPDNGPSVSTRLCVSDWKRKVPKQMVCVCKRLCLVIKGPVTHFLPHCAKNKVNKEMLRDALHLWTTIIVLP